MTSRLSNENYVVAWNDKPLTSFVVFGEVGQDKLEVPLGQPLPDLILLNNFVAHETRDRTNEEYGYEAVYVTTEKIITEDRTLKNLRDNTVPIIGPEGLLDEVEFPDENPYEWKITTTATPVATGGTAYRLCDQFVTEVTKSGMISASTLMELLELPPGAKLVAAGPKGELELSNLFFSYNISEEG